MSFRNQYKIDTSSNYFLERQNRKSIWDETSEGWETNITTEKVESSAEIKSAIEELNILKAFPRENAVAVDKSTLVSIINMEENHNKNNNLEKASTTLFNAIDFHKGVYLLLFVSGRTLLGEFPYFLSVGEQVVIASDREEDVASVIAPYTNNGDGDDCTYAKLIEYFNNIYFSEKYDEKTTNFLKTNYLHKKPIPIFRKYMGNSKFEHKEKEKEALNYINYIKDVYTKNVQITKCEYQWDAKRLTVYYRAESRIDFRGLVKELFKHFKVRIWMCSENRELYK